MNPNFASIIIMPHASMNTGHLSHQLDSTIANASVLLLITSRLAVRELATVSMSPIVILDYDHFQMCRIQLRSHWWTHIHKHTFTPCVIQQKTEQREEKIPNIHCAAHEPAVTLPRAKTTTLRGHPICSFALSLSVLSASLAIQL